MHVRVRLRREALAGPASLKDPNRVVRYECRGDGRCDGLHEVVTVAAVVWLEGGVAAPAVT